MKTQGWYKVIKDEEYFKEFLGIFSEFHDYRITHIEYDSEKNHLMLYLRYDTDEEGAVLKFINVKDMHICPCDDYEISWLSGSALKMTSSYSLFWYNVDDEDNIDEIKKDKNLTWIVDCSEHFKRAADSKTPHLLPRAQKRRLFLYIPFAES